MKDTACDHHLRDVPLPDIQLEGSLHCHVSPAEPGIKTFPGGVKVSGAELHKPGCERVGRIPDNAHQHVYVPDTDGAVGEKNAASGRH